MPSVMTQSRKGLSRGHRTRSIKAGQETDRQSRIESGVASRVIQILLSYHNKNHLPNPQKWRKEKVVDFLLGQRAVHASLGTSDAEQKAILAQAFIELQERGLLRFDDVRQVCWVSRSALRDFYRQIDQQKTKECQAEKAAENEGLSLKERAVRFQEQRAS